MRYGVLGSAHGHVTGFCAEMEAAGHTLVAVLADGTDNAKTVSERYGVPLLATPEEVIACGIEAAGTFAMIDGLFTHGAACRRDRSIELEGLKTNIRLAVYFLHHSHSISIVRYHIALIIHDNSLDCNTFL